MRIERDEDTVKYRRDTSATQARDISQNYTPGEGGYRALCGVFGVCVCDLRRSSGMAPRACVGRLYVYARAEARPRIFTYICIIAYIGCRYTTTAVQASASASRMNREPL